MQTFIFLLVALSLVGAPALAAAQSEEETMTERAVPDAPEAVLPDTADAPLADVPRVPAEASAAAVFAIEQAVERLVQLEVALAAESSPCVDAARRELAEVRSSLRDALLAVGALRAEADLRTWLEERGVVGRLPSAPEPISPTPEGQMDEASLRSLAAAVTSAPFNEGKLQALRTGLDGRELSSVQASGLLELFSFSRDRVDVLVFLYPRLSDADNFEVLLSALKFESDRKAVRDRLGLDG